MKVIEILNNSNKVQQNQNNELLDLIARLAADVLDGNKYEIVYHKFPYEDRLTIRLQTKQLPNYEHTQYSPEAN